MKLSKTDFRGYESPEVQLSELYHDCILCSSPAASFDESQFEGYDKENDFTGWGN
jgi:hypothetical protein